MRPVAFLLLALLASSAACVHTDRPSAVVSCLASDRTFYYRTSTGFARMTGPADQESREACIAAFDAATGAQ